jgi:predicted metal-dependent RNase
MSTSDSRYTLPGPSAARAQGRAKVAECRRNCRGTLPSSVQEGIHKVNCAAREGALVGYKVNRRQPREGVLGHSVSRQGMSAISNVRLSK